MAVGGVLVVTSDWLLVTGGVLVLVSVLVGGLLVSVVVTGQTVVETEMVEVTVTVDSAGQLVTVGGHLVMV